MLRLSKTISFLDPKAFARTSKMLLAYSEVAMLYLLHGTHGHIVDPAPTQYAGPSIAFKMMHPDAPSDTMQSETSPNPISMGALSQS